MHFRYAEYSRYFKPPAPEESARPMLSMPQKIHIKRQNFISLRSRLSARLISQQCRVFFHEAREEALKQGVEEIGAAFMRLETFRDFDNLEADFGFFTDRPMRANGPFHAGSLPAADYLQASWRGSYERMRDIHVIIIQWADYSKLTIDCTRDESGLHFGCLLNVFNVCDLSQPDSSQWETDILFRLRRRRPGEAAEPFVHSLPPPISVQPD
jgi:hypothetical protein